MLKYKLFYYILFLCSTFLHSENVLNEQNSWAFKYTRDNFSNEALLDLRYLNEKESGQNGFVRLSSDGNDLVLGSGKSFRIWMIGSEGHRFSPEDMDHHTRWLAKLGVNMVRLHVTICNKKEGSKITDLNEDIIDGVYRFIHSAKRQGIYITLSPFYAHFDKPKSWGLVGDSKDLEGLIFFDPKLQNAYMGWIKEFFTRVNPYTKLAIKDDPTVAILQVHNEDSMFFWTAQRFSKAHRLMLSDLFTQWLLETYGSVSHAIQAWGEGPIGNDPLDDLKSQRLACLPIYNLTQDAKGAYERRINDTARFLAELQYDFYKKMGRYIRDTLGCKQLLNASNWRTANDTKLKALERYSYQALDIDAENEYIGSDFQHRGNNQHFRIDAGHYLVNESVLPKPFEFCTNFKQEEGHPFIVTETAWKNPNRYQSEGPFLVAAYQSLNGLDGVSWFNCLTPSYEQNPLKSFWKVNGQMSTHKWNHCYPAMISGFPANALLYRQGYLKQAPTIVREVRALEDIFSRKKSIIEDNETHGDQRNLPDLQPDWKGEEGEINRIAFMVGPIKTSTGVHSEFNEIRTDLSKYFDPEAGIIRSATGELIWNYKAEWCSMNAPKAQGITGFLKRNGGIFVSDDLTIESENDYATINAVSLDDQPLYESKKVLIQVVTINRLTGYKTKAATFTVGGKEKGYSVTGEQIESIGKPPFRIENTEVRISINNKYLKKASFLDLHGIPQHTVDLINGKVILNKDTIYCILHE